MLEVWRLLANAMNETIASGVSAKMIVQSIVPTSGHEGDLIDDILSARVDFSKRGDIKAMRNVREAVYDNISVESLVAFVSDPRAMCFWASWMIILSDKTGSCNTEYIGIATLASGWSCRKLQCEDYVLLWKAVCASSAYFCRETPLLSSLFEHALLTDGFSDQANNNKILEYFTCNLGLMHRRRMYFYLTNDASYLSV
jgi:hypothetical protein